MIHALEIGRRCGKFRSQELEKEKNREKEKEMETNINSYQRAPIINSVNEGNFFTEKVWPGQQSQTNKKRKRYSENVKLPKSSSTPLTDQLE